MRVRKPWFRKSKNAWFVEKDGRQIRLAVGRENEKAALQAFYKLMAGQTLVPNGPGVQVAIIFDLFLDYSKARHTAESYQHYRHFLNNFCQKWGTLQVADVKAFHVTRWLDDRPSWKGSRRSAIIAVKRGFSWAEQEGLIPANPIKHVKKPPAKSRTRVITSDEKAQILKTIPDEGFRNFVVAMQESGCRPGEISLITAENFDSKLGVWVLQQHKTSAKPLTRRAIQKMVETAVDQLGLDPHVTVHSFRVTALTTARERGSDIIDLQDFAGHADPRTTLGYIRNRDRLKDSPAYLLKF